MSTAIPSAAPENAFAVAPKTKKSSIATIADLLSDPEFSADMRKVLPAHITAERMARVALTTVKGNDKLQRASIKSLAAAMLKCSQYGLLPDGRNAHLIPFKSGTDRQGNDIYDVQLIFDYKGLVDLVLRSGDVSDVKGGIVFEDDEFMVDVGSDRPFVHRPNFRSKKRGVENAYAVYSFITKKDGTKSFEVLTVDEVNAVRDRSAGYIQAKDKAQSVWGKDWFEMAKKTAFRRHTKWLALSPETVEAINSDDDTLEEMRFKSAKQAKAAVVPNFGEIGDAPHDEPEPAKEPAKEPGGQAEQPQAQTQPPADPPPPVPHDTLGEQPKKAKAPVEAGSRTALVEELRQKFVKSGISESGFIAASVKLDKASPARAVSVYSSDTLKIMIADYDAILAEVAE